MSDEHTAFLRAIVENPRDMLARLVYADYLEETGDPNHVARAHLIRTQIALSDPTTPDDEYQGLQAFEERLMDMFREDWDRELPLWLFEEEVPRYRRGFVEHVSLTLNRFTASATHLFSIVPLLSLHLVPPSSQLTELSRVFDRVLQLAAVKSLKLGPHMGCLTDFGPYVHEDDPPPLFRELMTCRTLSGLQILDLSKNRISDAWLTAFISALPETTFASTLEVLNLSDSFHLTDASGITLTDARCLSGLKRLILKDVPFSAAMRANLRRAFGERVTF